MKIFSSKKRVAAIGVVTAATLVGGGMAYAYWTTTGEGTGSASTGSVEAFTVVDQLTDKTAGELAPGGPTQIAKFKVHNPGDGTQNFTQVTVTVADSDGSTWDAVSGCSASDFVLGTAAHGDPFTISLPTSLPPGGTTAEQSVTVQMWNNPTANQNDCQGVTDVPLYYDIS